MYGEPHAVLVVFEEMKVHGGLGLVPTWYNVSPLRLLSRNRLRGALEHENAPEPAVSRQGVTALSPCSGGSRDAARTLERHARYG